MVSYHGTNVTSAMDMFGPPRRVDVHRGGGELGRGFYTGESIGLAKSLAHGRYGDQGVVLRLDIDDRIFVTLKVRVVAWRKHVYRTWRAILFRDERNTFLFNVDVVLAPFATLQLSYQYKFESKSAQDVLNNRNHTEIELLR